ncbi:DUF2272 domain-containing protein [Roseomonas sp. GC11]|uniref:DUF2272 domain-containing protein n=1 Tax=Roseomonas sp. GC11 TaxID=2950546 RepID=UPI00210EBE18|nr:DUF2272 domain-containing protein [Roseomonas sp. GC11]MCQ4162316.1 DUF2272 domain-containing protein [Roseomonas sp. GC11]
MRAALPLLLLAACAAPPPPPAAAPAPPLSYPASARERMLRIALEEWAEWGRITLAAGEHRPSPQPAPEGELENFPRVLAYWRAVPEGAEPIRRNRARYAAALASPGIPEGLWSEPAWSAAFISYVMRGAGVDQREFPSSAAHAFYLDGLLADARAFPDAAPFLPHEVADYAPQPGDLVCADRSPRPLRSWTERPAEAGQFRPMHCDIVVRTLPGEVQAVGGNVADAVTLSRFAADGAGRLLPRGPGAPAWFAVFENRLGRLPPWTWRPAS